MASFNSGITAHLGRLHVLQSDYTYDVGRWRRTIGDKPEAHRIMRRAVLSSGIAMANEIHARAIAALDESLSLGDCLICNRPIERGTVDDDGSEGLALYHAACFESGRRHYDVDAEAEAAGIDIEAERDTERDAREFRNAQLAADLETRTLPEENVREVLACAREIGIPFPKNPTREQLGDVMQYEDRNGTWSDAAQWNEFEAIIGFDEMIGLIDDYTQEAK